MGINLAAKQTEVVCPAIWSRFRRMAGQKKDVFAYQSGFGESPGKEIMSTAALKWGAAGQHAPPLPPPPPPPHNTRHAVPYTTQATSSLPKPCPARCRRAGTTRASAPTTCMQSSSAARPSLHLERKTDAAGSTAQGPRSRTPPSTHSTSQQRPSWLTSHRWGGWWKDWLGAGGGKEVPSSDRMHWAAVRLRRPQPYC